MTVETVFVKEVSDFVPAYLATGTKIFSTPGVWSSDADGQLLAEGDVVEQTKVAYRNLATLLAGLGADFSNLIQVNHYVVNLNHDDIAGIFEAPRVVADELGQPAPPIAPHLGVTALGQPGFLIEVTAIAVLA